MKPAERPHPEFASEAVEGTGAMRRDAGRAREETSGANSEPRFRICCIFWNCASERNYQIK